MGRNFRFRSYFILQMYNPCDTKHPWFMREPHTIKSAIHWTPTAISTAHKYRTRSTSLCMCQCTTAFRFDCHGFDRHSVFVPVDEWINPQQDSHSIRAVSSDQKLRKEFKFNLSPCQDRVRRVVSWRVCNATARWETRFPKH